VISVPPVGRARFQLDENRAAPSGFASETNNGCQIKSKLLHLNQREKVFLTKPLSPIRQRRALERQFVTEVHFTAEEL
jgi:hypothetical protein